MSIQNPLWQVHNALWTLLESDSDFTTAVKSMNRIKYNSTTDREPDKKSASSDDFPMVRIRCIGGTPRAHRTSNSSTLSLHWAIEILSGDQRLATQAYNKSFDVQWAVYKALVNWKSYLYDFTWDSNDFKVRYCRAHKSEDTLTNEDLQRNQRGWQSIWTGETEIWFTTTDMTS